MKKIIFIIYILTPIKSISQELTYTQQNIDTIDLNPVSLEKLNHFKTILKKDDNLKGWVKLYAYKGYYYLKNKKNDSAIMYSNMAITAYNNYRIKYSNEEKYLVNPYYIKGLILNKKGYYISSTKYLLKALKLAKKYNHPWESYVINRLAINHLKIGDNKKALKYNKMALKDQYFNSDNDHGPTYLQVGSVFKYLNLLDSSKIYCHKALSYNLSNKNIVSAYNSLGEIFKIKKNRDSAIFYFKMGLELNKNLKVKDLALLSNRSYIFINEGNFDKAINNSFKMLDSLKGRIIDKEVRDIKNLNYEYLEKAFIKKENYRKAYNVAKMKNVFLTEFHKKMMQEKIELLNIEFDITEKDESIKQLKNITKNQNILIHRRSFFILILTIVILLIIVSGGLLIKQKNLQNKYEKINLEQRLLRSQMNPHFIFNTINVISNLTKNKSDKTTQYILKFSNLLRLILINSREEFVSIKNEILALNNYLVLQSNFSDKFLFHLIVDKCLDKSKIFIPPMLIQPFVENSIKHGFNKNIKGEISIKFTLSNKENLIKCYIDDNGIGYTKSLSNKSFVDNKYKSVSNEIVSERLKIYKKQFKVNTHFKIIDKYDKQKKIIGTQVIIFIPYIEE